MRMTSGGHDSKLVLLIEDDADDERLTRLALRRNNIMNEIVVACDGQEALDYLTGSGHYENRDTSILPSVIFIDLNIPKVSGLDVLRHIRSHEATRRIPVIILTGSNDPKAMEESYLAGANSYVVKPTDPADLSDTVLQLGMYWLLLNRTVPERQRA